MRVTSSETLTLFRVKLFWSCSQSAGGSCLVRSQKSLQDYCHSFSPGLFLHFCDVLPLNTTKRTDYFILMPMKSIIWMFYLQEPPFRTPWRISTCWCPSWSWSLLMWRSGGTESFRDPWPWATKLDSSMLTTALSQTTPFQCIEFFYRIL